MVTMKETAFRLAIGVTVVLATAASLPACSKAAESKEAVATADGAPAEPETATMGVEPAPNGVVIDNRVGRRLLNVRISIDVNESALPFILVVPTIEKETKSLFEFIRFRSEEATMLDPDQMHLTRVTVTARDTFARSHEVTVPWTPTP